MNLGGGVFESKFVEGTATRFRADGKIDLVRATNGNRVTPGYDTLGCLISLTHSNGAALTFQYDAAGRIRSVTDCAGRVTTYGYDATNDYLTSVTAATMSFTILRRATTNPVVLTTAPAGSLMTFEMTVKPGVPLGSSGYLRYLGPQGAANTEILTLSGDTIDFNPVVSNPEVRGLVTAPVPDPSTLNLGGVAAVAGLIMGKQRKARAMAVRSMH